MKELFFLVLCGCITIACHGRKDDSRNGITLDMEAFGLSQNSPALLSFGAVWCKPCRSEISMINDIASEYKDSLQVRGYLVEGVEKGTISAEHDREQFLSFEGIAPLYAVELDANWQLFNKIPASEGKTLPLFAFVNQNGLVSYILQRSPKGQEELQKLVNLLVSNRLTDEVNNTEEEPKFEAADEAEKNNEADDRQTSNSNNSSLENEGDSKVPKNTPDTNKGNSQNTGPSVDSTEVPVTPPIITDRPQVIEIAIKNWIKDAPDPLQKNLRKSWQSGRSKFGFTSEEMPYGDGQLTLKLKDDSYFTAKAVWVTESGCRLDVVLDKEAKFINATGICKQ